MKNKIIKYLIDNNISVDNIKNLTEIEILKNPLILNIILKNNYVELINYFKEEAWNEENITYLFKIYSDINFISLDFRNSSKILYFVLKNEIFNNINIFTNKAINEEIENLFIEKCKINNNIKIPYIFMTESIINKLIRNRLLNYASMININWTDDNINLFCKMLDNYNGDININTILFKKSQVLYSLLKNKKYINIKYFSNTNIWNKDCIELLVNNLEEYLNSGYRIPNCLYNNIIVLNKILQLDKKEYIEYFKEEAWNEENICLLLNKNQKEKKLPWNLKKSSKALYIIIKYDYYDYIQFFSKEIVTEEIENLFIEKCKKNLINKIPTIFNTNKILNKLLENNLLNYAVMINYHNWKQEQVKEFCQKLDNYHGIFKLIAATVLNDDDIIYAFLKNKKYAILNYVSNIDSKCIDLLLDNIDDYLKKGNEIPYQLYENSRYLNMILKKNNLDIINNFSINAFNEENIYIIINKYYRGELEYSDLPFQIRNIELVKYMLMDKNTLTNKLYYDTKVFLEYDATDENLKKEYRAYAQFILKTNSQDIYEYINILLNNNMNLISKYFNENGPNEKLLQLLVFNAGYQYYCREKNINILSNITNKAILKYIDLITLFPNLNNYIYIDYKNYQEYFDNEGPKIELYNFLFNDKAYELLYNINQLYPKLSEQQQLILEKTLKIENKKIRKIFFNFCSNKNYNKSQIDNIYLIIKRIENSNSSELSHIREPLIKLLLEYDNPNEKLIEIENIFLKNNLPIMGKIYKVFDIMHPNFEQFNTKYESPNLNAKSNPFYKQIIVFSDLMNITIGSNNRSLKEYINNIEIGNNIIKEIIYNDIDIRLLDEKSKEILNSYLEHLKTLYNNTLKGKNNPITLSGSIKKDIFLIISSFYKTEKDFNIDKLPDKIVKMFAHFAGIDTIDELKSLIDTTIKSADEINRKRAEKDKFEIHKGDFIKGLANQDKHDEFYTFLTNIFQNGSLCKELLGDAARSDSTPMDTDVSRLLEEPSSFEEAFTNSKYASSRYGPLWIVLKNDERFNETNKSNNKYIPGKLEVFETNKDGIGHYGIRTGFASSDIDYLVVDEKNIKMDRIKYEIVMNGFYIPVVNTKGNLVFTPYEYDILHKKMAGLSYYGTENEYTFAPELDNFDINNTEYNIDIIKSINEVTKVREEVISKLKETDLDIKLGRSLDLSEKCIDLIDTGSTSRGTNKMNGYDLDFVMSIDKEIYIDENKMNSLLNKFKAILPNIKITGKKIRNQEITLSNGKKVKLDITFIMKTNKMDYTTEECLQDRLNTIKRIDKEKYKKVLENIVLAKYVLSSVYKSKNATENPQGGLGGVGIENWILQNGGSFEKAARDFIEEAKGKSFKDFTKVYTVWDFGQNNLSFKRDDGYTHDEFIKNNMNEQGYHKMINILNKYINSLESRNNYSKNI